MAKERKPEPQPLTAENMADKISDLCGLPQEGARLLAALFVSQHQRIERLTVETKILEGRLQLYRTERSGAKL